MGDLGVRVAADESAHTDADAARRIELGYGAIALKPIAKTLSMTLRIARLAHEKGVPCFCADLTVNPILVDWNKVFAARLAPLPGLSLGLVETNGHQNYRNWEAMRRHHPCFGASGRAARKASSASTTTSTPAAAGSSPLPALRGDVPPPVRRRWTGGDAGRAFGAPRDDRKGPSMTTANPKLDQLCVNTIRTLSIDAVQKANSGHPGHAAGRRADGLRRSGRASSHNPANPAWPDRDRFVLSAGHGSMLLYSLLHLTGYDLPLDDLKHFRQWGSRTPGHPEYGDTPGVEATTGPLGQGFATRVGMAIAEAHLAARVQPAGPRVVDHRTYVLVSDGDLMEGVAPRRRRSPATSGSASSIVFYDANHIYARRPDRTCPSPRTSARASRRTAGTCSGRRRERPRRGRRARSRPRRRRRTGRRSIIVHTTSATAARQAGHLRRARRAARRRRGASRRSASSAGRRGAVLRARRGAARTSRGAVERGQAARGRVERARSTPTATAHPDLAAEFERRSRASCPKGWDADLPTFTPADEADRDARRPAGR